MDKSILIGTSNPHKVAMLRRILEHANLRAATIADVFGDNAPDVDETGKTFQENAGIKAVALSKLYEGYVIATDGGVSIPALGDKWNGLYTRRFAGEDATDEVRIAKLLALTKDLSDAERKIIWQEAVAVAKDGAIVSSQTYDGAEGTLTREYEPQKYMPGIWVCSLWYVDAYKKHFFDMSPAERDASNTSWQKIGDHIKQFFGAAQSRESAR